MMRNQYKKTKKCVIGEDGTLCWYCKTNDCEWHSDLQPVPGWDATQHKVKLQPYTEPQVSHHVFDCPNFERGHKEVSTDDPNDFMKALGANCVKEYMNALRYLHRFDGVPYESLIDSQRHRYNEMVRVVEHEETFILSADTFFGMRSKDVIEMIKRRVFDE